jgi:hypothetical protein
MDEVRKNPRKRKDRKAENMLPRKQKTENANNNGNTVET